MRRRFSSWRIYTCERAFSTRAAEHYLAAFEQHEVRDSLLALQVANQMFRKGQFKEAREIFVAIGDDKTGWGIEDLTRLGYLQAEFCRARRE